MRNLVIRTSDSQKGRAFRAIELACVESDSLWEGGRTSTNNVRPIWIMLAGSDNELRPFVANLRMGKKAEVPNGYSRRNKDCIELLKSAGYNYTWQRMSEGSVVTAFLPDLFRLDPGMVDPKGIKFVLLPSRDYIEKQAVETDQAIKHVAKVFKVPDNLDLSGMVTVSALFAAYLDRRTRCPLVADTRFYLQLYLACLDKGLASWSHSSYSHYREFGQSSYIQFNETDTETVGLLPGVAFQAQHEEFEELMAEQVKVYFEAIK